MSINHILDTGICPPSWTRVRAHRVHSCTDVQFDGELIGVINLNRNIPPGAHGTFLHTDSTGHVIWKLLTKSDIPPGNDGDYLQTIAGAVEWAPPSAITIAPGAANQVFVTNSAGTLAVWDNNLNLVGTLEVNGASNIKGNLQFNGVSGTSGQYLKKTGATTQAFSNLSFSDFPLGTSRQLLQMNPAGTALVYTSNLFLPVGATLNVSGTATFTGSATIGTLTVGGLSTFSDVATFFAPVDHFDAINLNSDPGLAGQVLTSEGVGATPTWNYQTFTAKYYDTHIYDLNSAASVNLMAGATDAITNPNITYSGDKFIVTIPGQYRLLYTTTLSSALDPVIVYYTLDGTYVGSAVNVYDATAGKPQPFTLDVIISVTGGSEIEVIANGDTLNPPLSTLDYDPRGVPASNFTITYLGKN
jgi:hypothetical protein